MFIFSFFNLEFLSPIFIIKYLLKMSGIHIKKNNTNLIDENEIVLKENKENIEIPKN